MLHRNYKCCIFSVLVLFGVVLVVSFGGCSDDPKSADDKQIRQKTTDALEMTAQGADDDTLQSAQSKVQQALGSHRQATSDAKNAATLASGSLALARGRRMQSDLDLKMLPLREAVRSFEKTVRSCEDLLIEKERIQAIWNSGQQEMTELKQSVDQIDQQLAGVNEELNQLQAQKQQEQVQKDKTQAVLDDYQSRADGLLRKAELSEGDEKLELEKQAYAILKDRKQYYIDVQASEDKIVALDAQIQLVQSQADGLKTSIQEMQDRINAIDTSPTRIALKQQLRQVEQTISVNQQQLTSDAGSIRSKLDAFRAESREVCDVFEAAAAEFEKINSPDTRFAANLQSAESYYQAALACAASIHLQIDVSLRLEDLLKTTEPTFANLLQGKLPITMDIEAAQSRRVMDFYDKAIDAYQKAFDAAGSMGQDTRCSVLKSQLLAVDSKMQLADRLNLPDVAEQADAQRRDLIQRGQEYGDCFMQSETKKLIEYGIDYTPSLPVNLEVLAEELVTRFSAWKQLPLAEQEAAVEENLVQIDELIGRYGEALGEKLEPLKREMLDAQQRGFEEAAPGSTGYGEPNSF